MDRLSIDVLHLIVDTLASDHKLKLSQYATVSRPWQRAIERHTFYQIHVSSLQVPRFREIFDADNQIRSTFVRWLVFDTVIPRVGQTVAEHNENTSAMGEALAGLFAELAQWDVDGNRGSPNRGLGNRSLYLEFGYRRHRPRGSDAANIRCESFSVPDEVLNKLPFNSSVTKFSTSDAQGFAFSPVTTSYLASRMKSLEDFEFMYIDAPNHRRDLRKACRVALRDSFQVLSNAQLKSLWKLVLERSHPQEPRNHNFDCQDFTDENGVDGLCEAIRGYVQEGGIRQLELIGLPITADLFRCSRQCATQADPKTKLALWPSLESLSISSGIVQADGKWLFTGDRTASPPCYQSPSISSASDEDESDDDESDGTSSDEDQGEDSDSDIGTAQQNGMRPENKWRRIPDPDVFNHLVTDLSEAMLLMPRLQSVDFFVNISHPEDGITLQAVGPDRKYKVAYMDKIKPFTTGKLFPYCRVKCWVGVDTEWEAPQEVLDAWRRWVGADGTVETATYSVT